jgi:nitrate/TMAO reductase-like tetraheme cytochrome c subunit
VRARVPTITATLLAVACTLPVPFASDLLFSTEREQLPEAQDCARCHGEVFREWQGSAHARAWTSESFARVTADHRADACLGCHAPAPLGAAGEIALRSDHRAEGVTCVSCHLDVRPGHERLAMRGPHPPTTPIEVHAIVVDPLFLSPELCGTCHTAVLEEWEASAARSGAPRAEMETCQHCHMPEVRRTIESYNPELRYSALIVALGDPVDGRRHLFAVPEDAGEDVRLRAERLGTGVRVTVENHLPHAIATGGFGTREARLLLRSGAVERVTRLRRALGEQIAAGATRTFEFVSVPRESPVEIALERRAHDGAYEAVARLHLEPAP